MKQTYILYHPTLGSFPDIRKMSRSEAEDQNLSRVTDGLEGQWVEQNSVVSVQADIIRPVFFEEVPVGSRFWGQPLGPMFGNDYLLSVKKEDGGAKLVDVPKVYFPSPETIVLLKQNIKINFKSHKMTEETVVSPAVKGEKATKKAVAKKKGSKKPAKKAAPKKAAAKKEGPTKKELVAKYLKQGKKASEILELLKKNHKVESTLASVRAFIQTINNGG